MTNEEILRCLKTARDNTVKALAEVTPGTDEYSRMLYGYDQLRVILERFDDPTENDATCAIIPVEPAGHPDPVGEPGEPGVPEQPAPEPVHEPAPAAEKVSREELRAALAEAKKKGVVISELINSLGAKNFSGVADEKLPELKARMENALKELGV